MAPTFQTPSTSLGYKDITSGRYPEAVNPELFNELVDNNPFLAMIQQLRPNKRMVDQKVFYFQEDSLPPKVDAINNVAGYDNAVLTFIVDHDEYFCIGDIIWIVRTDEKMQVESISSGASTITVVARGWGGTSAYALLDNDEIRIMPRAYGDKESGDQVNVISQPGRDYNYIQDMQFNVPVSRAAQNRKLYQNITERQRLNDEGLKTFGRNYDMLLLAGTRYQDTSVAAAGDKYYMGGLKYFLPTTHIITAKPSGASGIYEINLSEPALNLKMAELLQGKGNPVKYAICGYKAMLYMMGLKATDLQQKNDDQVRNLRINEYRGSIRLKLVDHFAMTGEMADFMFLVDPEYIQLTYFKGEEPRRYPDCQAPSDIRRILDIYQGSVSAEFAVPQVHALFKGVEIALP